MKFVRYLLSLKETSYSVDLLNYLKQVVSLKWKSTDLRINVERTDRDIHANRSTFFKALRDRGVNVLEGIAVRSAKKNNRVEKGVDVLVALQIYKEALNGARDIIVCSADSDLVPAVMEAQALGVRVHVVMSDYTPGCELSSIADRVISLETIVQSMLERGKVSFKDQEKPFLFTNAECFKEQRKGLQYA